MLEISEEYLEEEKATCTWTSLIRFLKFKSFDDEEVFQNYCISLPSLPESQAFRLFYSESDDGEGYIKFFLYHYTQNSKKSDRTKSNDDLNFLVDGQKVSLEYVDTEFATDQIVEDYYILTIDVLMLISKAEKVKYSFRGVNGGIVEGYFTRHHIEAFKAFQEICFGNESEGRRIVSSVNEFEALNDAEENRIKEFNSTGHEQPCYQDPQAFPLRFVDRTTRVESYLQDIKKYIDEDKSGLLKERLMRMDESKLAEIVAEGSNSFKNPRKVFAVSLIAGWIGADRIMIGEFEGVFKGLYFLLFLFFAQVFPSIGFLPYVWYIIDWFLIMKRTRRVNTNKLQMKVPLNFDLVRHL
jgi:hypothetical protein